MFAMYYLSPGLSRTVVRAALYVMYRLSGSLITVTRVTAKAKKSAGHIPMISPAIVLARARGNLTNLGRNSNRLQRTKCSLYLLVTYQTRRHISTQFSSPMLI